MTSPKKVNLAEKFSLFDKHWSPKIVGEINDSYVKLVKIKDEFVWHLHEEEDEVFIVVKGEITIQFRDQNLTAKEGEMIFVPKKVEHCPIAKEEAWVMVIEPKTTLNTGNAKDSDKTVKNLEVL